MCVCGEYDSMKEIYGSLDFKNFGFKSLNYLNLQAHTHTHTHTHIASAILKSNLVESR